MRVKCPVCGQMAYCDKKGRMLLHTKPFIGENIGDKIRAVVCPGSDGRARP